MYFRNYGPQKTWLNISKKSSVREPFAKQHVKWEQTVLKSEPYHLYHIYSSLHMQLSWKKYLLVICKLLGVFVNILTADDKYSLLNSDNFR